jgi:hypothetical protein
MERDDVVNQRLPRMQWDDVVFAESSNVLVLATVGM